MKKPDIKELAVNHFEKALFGLFALLAVATLLGTRWVPYSQKSDGHYPQDITREVDVAQGKIAIKTWPEEEIKQFEVPREESVEELVRRSIVQQVDVTPYEFDLPFIVPINRPSKHVEEPEFLTVQAMLADPGRFLMGVPPEEELLEEETEGDPALMAEAETKDDQSEIPEEFRTRDTLPRGGGSGIPSEYALGESYGTEDDSMEGYESSDYGSYGGYGDYGGMGVGVAATMDGRGLRYVAVRGIIPLRDQIRRFMKALNIRSFSQASRLYEIIDFELERKKKQPGDDPWAGEWEPVDIEVAIDILNEALSFDPEVVPTAITDPVVTMPLPGRLMGIWKSKATHPQLENFTLSPEEMQKEMAFNLMMVQEYEKQQQNRPEEPVARKGFTSVVGGARAMQGQLFGTEFGDETTMEDESYGDGESYGGSYGGGYGMMSSPAVVQTGMTAKAQEFLDKIKNKQFTDDKERKEALLDYIKERVTAVGELLLFRYFDFDVEPGASYKYRVRLVVKNPNYGLPVVQAGGIQSVVEGQTRTTKWSNETEEATVPYDVDYFVARVEQRRSQLPAAHMAVFQWNPDLGTTVFDPRLVVSYGEEIGGPADTLVLDPAANRFERETYKFHTGDVLIDALPQVKINSREHPDLELPRSAKGFLSISGQVLISKGNDELAVIDYRSRIPAFEVRHKNLIFEQQPYEDIKNKEAQKPDPSELQQFGYGEYSGGEGMDEMEDMGYGGGMGMEDFGQGSRGRNALRKRRGGGR